MADSTGTDSNGLFLGDWSRALDERCRLSLPAEWVGELTQGTAEAVLAKERPGCVSLWSSQQWDGWMADGMNLVTAKIRSGRIAGRWDQVQMLGRLMSTRHRKVPIAGRGRIAIPDSFRDFLEVEPGGDVLVVGAAICVELWHPRRWSEHIGEHMPSFRQLFDQLAD
jgi:MraZ protein